MTQASQVLVTKNTINLSSKLVNIIEKANSMADQIYNQIIITDSYYDVGEVTSLKTYNVQLWNATFDNKTLLNIENNGANGVLLEGKENGVIGSNSVIDYVLNVDSDGDSVIDSELIFNFENELYNKSLIVEGSRVSLFDYDINWDSSDYPKVSYTHYTDIIESYSGKEQRVNVTENPRMKVSYKYSLSDSERIAAENKLYIDGSKKIQIPLFFQLKRLKQEINKGDNSAVFDVKNTILTIGRSVLIRNGNKKSVLKISNIIDDVVYFEETISNDFSLSSEVIPLVMSLIENDIEFTNYGTNFNNISLTFDLLDTEMSTITNTDDNYLKYDNLTVIDRRPTRAIDISKNMQRNFQTIDYTIGFRDRIQKDKTPAIVMSMDFSVIGEDEIGELTALFNNHKGKFGEFYINSNTNDFILKQDINREDLKVIVENNGQSNFNDSNVKNLLLFNLKNNEKVIKKVINYQALSNNEIAINIDSVFDKDIKISDVNNIQYLSNARFNNDTIQFNMISKDYAEVSIDTKLLRNA